MNTKSLLIIFLAPFLVSASMTICTNRRKVSKKDRKQAIIKRNKEYNVDKQRMEMIRIIRRALQP